MLDISRRAGGGFGCCRDKLMLKNYSSAQGNGAEAFETLEGQIEGARGAVEVLLNVVN